MPLVAKTEPGADLSIGGTHFVFDKDGRRQVSHAEAEILERYRANGGVLKITISNEKAAKAAKDGD